MAERWSAREIAESVDVGLRYGTDPRPLQRRLLNSFFRNNRATSAEQTAINFTDKVFSWHHSAKKMKPEIGNIIDRTEPVSFLVIINQDLDDVQKRLLKSRSELDAKRIKDLSFRQHVVERAAYLYNHSYKKVA